MTSGVVGEAKQFDSARLPVVVVLALLVIAGVGQQGPLWVPGDCEGWRVTLNFPKLLSYNKRRRRRMFLMLSKKVYIFQIYSSKLYHWPVSTSAMSMKWSSEAEASILPSWLKLRVLTGQSSLHRQSDKRKKLSEIQNNLRVITAHFYSTIKMWSMMHFLFIFLKDHYCNYLMKPKTLKINSLWPGEAADTHQLLHVPQADQRISTSCGKVLPCGVKLDADTVGRVSIDGLDGLQLGITANKPTVYFMSADRHLYDGDNQNTLTRLWHQCFRGVHMARAQVKKNVSQCKIPSDLYLLLTCSVCVFIFKDRIRSR